MNWTESALNRHSRRRGWNEDAARQKQYFARARLQAQHSATSPFVQIKPFIPSYIPQSSSLNTTATATQFHTIMPKASKPSPNRRLAQLLSTSVTVPPNGSDRTLHGSLLGKRSAQEQLEASASREGEEQGLEGKRRRLLEKTDWTGIEIQKPLVVDYSQGNCNLKNRTMPINKTDSQRQKNNITASQPRQSLPSHRHHKWPPSAVQQPVGSIQLRIGSQNLHWSRDGNTIRTSSSHGFPPSVQNWGSGDLFHSSPRVPSPVASHINHSSSSSSCLGIWSNPGETNGPRPCVSLQQGSRIPGSFNKGASPDRPKNIIHATPPMYHPRPSRAEKSRLLDIESPEPEVASSTIVEVGKTNEPIEQHALEEAHWASWLNSKQPEANTTSRNQHEDKNETKSITPGVSEAWNGSGDPVQQLSPQAALNAVLLDSTEVAAQLAELFTDDGDVSRQPRRNIQPPGLAEHVSTSNHETSPSPSVLQRKDPEHSRASGTGVRDLVLPSSHSLPEPPDAQDLMKLLAQEQPAPEEESRDHPVSGQGVQSEGDEDEIWRMFLLDDDGAEITRKAVEEAMDTMRRDLLQATEQAASDLAQAPSSPPTILSEVDDIISDPPSLTKPTTSTGISTLLVPKDEVATNAHKAPVRHDGGQPTG